MPPRVPTSPRRTSAGFSPSSPPLRLAAEQEGGLGVQVDALEQTWGVKAATLSTSRDLLTLVAMASAGVGGTLVPASAAYLAPAALRLVPVTDPSAAWSICAMWRGAVPSPGAARFLCVVEAV